MNIKVQRQKPSRGEGAQGELRLVIMNRGTWLYIKGGNQWHSLYLSSAESMSTNARQTRGDLQRKILHVAEREGGTAGTYGGANADTNLDGGSIMGPSNIRRAAKDDVAH